MNQSELKEKLTTKCRELSRLKLSVLKAQLAYTKLSDDCRDLTKEVSKLDMKLAKLDGRYQILPSKTPSRFRKGNQSNTPNGSKKAKTARMSRKKLNEILSDLDDSMRATVLKKYDKLT